MTINLKLTRNWKKAGYTIGRLYVNGEYLCNTLEDTDRGLKSSDALATIKAKKVYGETAIPSGCYEMKLTKSPAFSSKPWAKKYAGLIPLLMGVPGYTGVRIHPGNKPEDTLGCLLVGKNTAKGKLTESTVTYYRLMDKLVEAEAIYITIE